MKIKSLVIATAGLAIATAIPITVSAHSFYWWEKPRKVIVTKNTRIYKIKVRYPRYRSYAVKSSILKRGTVITTHHMASYDWSIQKKGYAHNSYYFWVMNSSSKPNWIKPYSEFLKNWDEKGGALPMPHHRVDGGNHYITKSVGGKAIANLKNYPKTNWYPYKEYIVGKKYNHKLRFLKVHSGNKKVNGWVLSSNLKLNHYKTYPKLYYKDASWTGKMYYADTNLKANSNSIFPGSAYTGIRFGKSKNIWIKQISDQSSEFNWTPFSNMTKTRPYIPADIDDGEE